MRMADGIFEFIPDVLSGLVFVECETVNFNGQDRQVGDAVIDHEVQARPVLDKGSLLVRERCRIAKQILQQDLWGHSQVGEVLFLEDLRQESPDNVLRSECGAVSESAGQGS